VQKVLYDTGAAIFLYDAQHCMQRMDQNFLF